MFRERLLELLKDKDSYTQDEYYRHSRSIAKLFLENEESSIKYIQNEATDEELYLLSDYFDEILRLTIEDNMYKALINRNNLMLENSKEAIERKTKVFECLKYSWI